MQISIIISTIDRKEILYESLGKAYQAIAGIDGEIIVINDSKTTEVLLMPEWTNKVKVLNNSKHGVASARNLGASKASAALLLFMDDDMWISADNIKTIISLHQRCADKICINLNWVYPPVLAKQIKGTQFGRYLSYFGFDSLKGWRKGLLWRDEDIFPVEGITSQNLSIMKSNFLQAGGYNEKFPLAGYEDYDFSRRLKVAGIQPYICPLSMMYHNEVDRMEVKLWLDRKKRGGETRRTAVKMGHTDLKLNYGFLKSSVYIMLIPLLPKFYYSLSLIPNVKALDPVYFKVLNTMLGIVVFEGYQKKI